VFEDVADNLLRASPAMRMELEAAKLRDAELARSARRQLEWVYRHSPYVEQGLRRYPIVGW
jgi:hypothetical protein